MNSKRTALLVAGVVWCGIAVSPTAQQSGMTIVPANPTVSVGQSQPFTATGAAAVTNVSAGGEYSCVRVGDGTVRCVGRNQFGQLGDGSWTNASQLVTVAGITTATRVIAGDEFACATLADGSAACWGLGERGQRGDGTFAQISLVPVPVSGLSNVTSLSAGYNHACARVADGTVRCWGDNLHGQLGDPSVGPAQSAVPVAASGVNSAVAVATGAFHTCALLADATVRCWGANAQGQLGDGTAADSAMPVTPDLPAVAAVAGGGGHTCAVLVDGTVQCWGSNYQGQLGDGTYSPSLLPVRVLGITSAIGIAAGWQHTCALLRDGTIQCWGEGEYGQRGDGTTTNSPVPAAVSGISGAIGVTAGWWHHSCALLADGAVRCWGINEWGQFGDGTATGSSRSVRMNGTGVTWGSSNLSIAPIGRDGVATAAASGATTITATDSSGATASTLLTVRQRAMLSLAMVGAGTGTVLSSPAGIDCGADCAELYDVGTAVRLTATASANSTLQDWSGCDTASATTCTATLDAAKTVTARFELKRFALNVSKTGLGANQGTVTSDPPGIGCGTDCSETYTIDTTVTLTASPSVLFNGWTGCDVVSGITCTVTMKSVKSVTAKFLAVPF
jgi:alpha-tubulin suppressor-like RCC1 family protein